VTNQYSVIQNFLFILSLGTAAVMGIPADASHLCDKATFKKVKGKTLYTYTNKTRLLPFNRTQSRVITGLLIGHNTPRRNLYIIGLIDSPVFRGGNLSPRLCECDALVSCRRTYLGSSVLDPEDVRSLNMGAVWDFSNGAGLPWFGHQITGHKGPVQKDYVHRDRQGSYPFAILFCTYTGDVSSSIMWYK
jgi:hypothetical protein